VDLRTALFLIGVAVFIAVLATIAVRSYRRASASSDRSWERLLERLAVVDRQSIAEVALDIVDEFGVRRTDRASATLEGSEIWKMLGGLEGVEALAANSTVLVDLAFYVQRWYPEAVVLAEQLRKSAREIEWHVDRLRAARQNGKLEAAFTEYAQRAAVVYYLMTKRLVVLYQHANFQLLADLERVL